MSVVDKERRNEGTIDKDNEDNMMEEKKEPKLKSKEKSMCMIEACDPQTAEIDKGLS